jgi:RHS repeat-associated protein
LDFVQWSGPSPAQDPANFQTINYKHDVYGRRIEKKVDGFSTRYVYDGDQVIAEYDGNNNLLRKYIYGPGIDQPVCMIEEAESETYYYHFDGLGSVVALSDSSGDTVQTYEYSVYGQVAVEDVNNPNPYMFAGRRYDIEIGLYYNRARYYNPYTGRFLQADPIGYDADMNLYRYCNNNPLAFVDPSGSRASYYDMKWVASGGTWLLGVTFYNDNGSVADFMTFLDYDEFLNWAKTTDCCDLLPNFEQGAYGPPLPPPFPQQDPPPEKGEDHVVAWLTISGTASFGWTVFGAIGIAWDDEGNISLLLIPGAGAGTPSASFAASFGFALTDMSGLKGVGNQTGGTGLAGGGDAVTGGQGNNTWTGGEVQVNVASSSWIVAETHSIITNTYMGTFNANDVVNAVIQAIKRADFDPIPVP